MPKKTLLIDRYSFVGPTPPVKELLDIMGNNGKYQAWLDRRYNMKQRNLLKRVFLPCLSGEDGDFIRVYDVHGRSFRAPVASEVLIPDMFRTVTQALQLPESHLITQVNGGGHQAGSFAINALVSQDILGDIPMESQKVFVDSALGGAFRHSLSLSQVRTTLEKFLPPTFRTDDAKRQLVTDLVDGMFPTAEQLERAGIRYFCGTANETSTAHQYSEADFAQLRAWKQKDPDNRFILLDITSAIGAVPLSQYWDIIDVAFFPPQKALKAPAETGFVVFGPHAIAHIKHAPSVRQDCPNDKPIPLDEVSGFRSIAEKYFYNPKCDRNPVQVINSINLRKICDTTLCTDYYIRKGGEEASVQQGEACYQTLKQWMDQHKGKFDFFVADEANRSRSVAGIIVKDPRFSGLRDAEQRSLFMQRFHDYIGDKVVRFDGGKVLKPCHHLYDIKSFPATPLSDKQTQRLEEETGSQEFHMIRFWLNMKPALLEQKLQAISRAYEVIMQETLREGPARVYR